MFTPILPKGEGGFTQLPNPQHGQTREQLSAAEEAASPDQRGRGDSAAPTQRQGAEEWESLGYICNIS